MRPTAARFSCALMVAASLAGCSRTTSPPQWFAESRAAGGEISRQGATALRCVTAPGTVSAEGEGLGVVRWHVSEHVVGPTRERVTQALDEFAVTHAQAGDTLVLGITPPAAADVYATADVSLGIPFGMDCLVENATAAVHASDLRGLLRVRGSGDVTVERHTARATSRSQTEPSPSRRPCPTPASASCRPAPATSNCACRHRPRRS